MTTEAQTNPGSIPLSGEQLGRSEPSERIIISKRGAAALYEPVDNLMQVYHRRLHSNPSQNEADTDWME